MQREGSQYHKNEESDRVVGTGMSKRTVEEATIDFMLVRYTSANEHIKGLMFHLVDEALLVIWSYSVASIRQTYGKNVGKLAKLDRFLDSPAQKIVESNALIAPVSHFVKFDQNKICCKWYLELLFNLQARTNRFTPRGMTTY